MIDLFLATLWQILWGEDRVGFWSILLMIVVSTEIDTQSNPVVD